MQDARSYNLLSRTGRYAWFVLCCLVLNISVASAVDFDEYPAALDLVAELSADTGLDPAWVEAIVRDSVYSESIIKAITKPAEKFPWHRYQPLFVTESSADIGVKFWNRHAEDLQRAEQEYGVDAAVIVAIIGVETRYGKITGRHRVIDSLVTLVLGYPRRKEFFQKELAEFIKLTEEEKLDPFEIRGSYAGAMGIPQFISSSYRNYAVDFNTNKQRDLLTETADAIGSVANYLREHGWRAGGQLFAHVEASQGKLELNRTKGLETDRTFSAISDQVALVDFDGAVSADTKIGVVKLEEKSGGFDYRIAFSNFYVITKYNRSTLYAMAVAELSQLISSKRSKN